MKIPKIIGKLNSAPVEHCMGQKFFNLGTGIASDKEMDPPYRYLPRDLDPGIYLSADPDIAL